jgi:hypothetical protein
MERPMHYWLWEHPYQCKNNNQSYLIDIFALEQLLIHLPMRISPCLQNVKRSNVESSDLFPT